MASPRWTSRAAACLALLLSASLPAVAHSATAATVTPAERSAASPDRGAAQLLVYRGETLLTQGSAVAVAEEGILATAAHLLRDGDRFVVRDADGRDLAARPLKAASDLDLALLEVVGWPHGAVPIARGDAQPQDTVTTIGFWRSGLESGRSQPFFGRAVPRFQAEVHTAVSRAPGVVGEGKDGTFVYFAEVGRGGYGAGAFNRCGELVGITRRAPGVGDADLWRPHILSGRVTALNQTAIAALMLEAGHEPRLAVAACASAATGAMADSAKAREDASKARAETEAERRKREAAEAAAAKERDRRKAAEDEARRVAEQAQRSEEARKQTAAAAEQLGTQVQQQKSQIETALDALSERTKALAVAGAVAVLIALLAAGLFVSRRRALARAAAAAARFPDCEFVGTASDGQPLAVKVSGLQLRQSPDGLLVGRNPAQVHVVVPDETVSRVHARLRLAGDRVTITDAGSTGGTQVEGRALAKDEPAELAEGSRVILGSVALTFRIDGGIL